MQGEEGQATDFASAKRELSDRLRSESEASAQAVHDARDAVSQTVSEGAAAAKEKLASQAEGSKRDLGESLGSISSALRAAGEQLSQDKQQGAAKLLDQAAGGLDTLSTSLREKPLMDILSDVRSFSQQNQAALFAGAVAAGFALSRLLKGVTAESQPTDRQGGNFSGAASGSAAVDLPGSGSPFSNTHADDLRQDRSVGLADDPFSSSIDPAVGSSSSLGQNTGSQSNSTGELNR